MFNKSDKGREILIHNTNSANWLIAGRKYKILEVLSSNVVRLQDGGANKSWSSGDGGGLNNYSFVDGIQVDIGDEISLSKNTQSLKQGDIKKILSFVNNDKSKLVVEGILPGGWIDIKHVTIIKTPEKYRFRTLGEFMESMGGIRCYGNLTGQINEAIIKSIPFGKPLTEAKVFRTGADLYFEYTTETNKQKPWRIPDYFIQPIQEETRDLDVYLISKNTMQSLGINPDHNWYKIFGPFENKLLSSISKFGNNPQENFNFLYKIYKNGEYETKLGNINYHLLEVRASNEKSNADKLPF